MRERVFSRESKGVLSPLSLAAVMLISLMYVSTSDPNPTYAVM